MARTMTSTTMISISVKPFCALFTCLPHQLIERQNRQQDGQNDDQHHCSHKNQHKGFEQPDQQRHLGPKMRVKNIDLRTKKENNDANKIKEVLDRRSGGASSVSI